MSTDTAAIRSLAAGHPPKLQLLTVDGAPILEGHHYFDANGVGYVIDVIDIFPDHKNWDGAMVIAVRANGSRICWWNLYAAKPLSPTC